jgi:hypothetical protein
MSASVSFPLRYVLPTTALTLGATLRFAVVVDDQGGHLEPEVVVALSASWHPAPLTSVRRVLAVGETSLPGSLPVAAVPGSLCRAFDRAHPRTAALICDLSARSEQYLAGLRMGEDPAQVVTFGQALEVVHRELAAADRARREWVSRQGWDLRTAEWDLSGADMISVDGSHATLPGDTEVPAGRASQIAREYGLLIAICTDEADEPHRGRAESAGVVLYRRVPDALPDGQPVDPARLWTRDDALSRLRLADAGDPVAEIPAQRHGNDSAHLVAPMFGQLLGSDPLLEAASRAARTQLELLNVSDEYSRLAATQYRADEIAALQHEMRLAYLPRQQCD